MKPRPLFVQPFTACLLSLLAALLPPFLGLGFVASADDRKPVAAETTIRNVTSAPVSYSFRFSGSEAAPTKKTVAPQGIDRFAQQKNVVVEFTSGSEKKSYELDQGKPFSFRLDTEGKLELYQGAHGSESVPDLAPFVPTPMTVVNKMLDLLALDAKSVVYDIGCGDGRIVIAAAKKLGSRGVGIDIVPDRIRESQAGAKAAGVEALVEFRLEDAFKVDVTPATAVALYLLPESNVLLRPKLEKELKPGVLVVSHNYEIEGWEDRMIRSETVKDETGKEHELYLYRKK